MTSLFNFFTHKFFKVLLALYLGLFSLIWLISSPIAKHYLTPILAEQQLQLSDDASIRFNPFLMRVTLADIKLSTLQNPEINVFTLAELKLQVALWQLAFDKIVVSKFVINQGTLRVTQHDNELVIAGITLPKAEDDTAADDNATETMDEGLTETTAEPTTEFPYQFVLPDFILSNFTIDIERDTQQQKNKTHHINIEQLALSQVKATQDNQEANLALTALIDQTELALTANTNLNLGKGDINSNIRLSNYPVEKLARYVEDLNELKGSLSFTSQQTITLADTGINLRVQKANLGLQNLLIGLPKHHLTLNELQYNFADIAIDLQDNALTHLDGKSNIKLSNLAVNDNETTDTITSFRQLELADINFLFDEEPSVDITDIVLEDFLFSKKAKLADEIALQTIERINDLSEQEGIDISAEALVKLPPVLELKKLTVNNLKIHEKNIAINSIIFDTLTGEVIVKENKELANLIALADKTEQEPITEGVTVEPVESKENTEQDVANTDTEVKEEAFIFSFNELRFINDNSFAFSDFSVDPFYQRTLYIDTLELGALSNGPVKKQEQTPFALVGRSDKYANFSLAGYLQPFAEIATYHLEGDFKEFSLPAISSYLKGSTGIEVKTGQLNTALNVTLTGDELDGNVVVLLQALETALVDEEEAGSLISQGALPLNMAMGMLKDSDGNVELEVPLSGSTSDPQFGMSSIITLITQKAIMSATQDYLMTTFVPYANIVSIAITAGEFALKLRFDDLEYNAKQIEVGDNQSTYLTEFIALMHDKEDTRVTLCAVSTPADIDLPAGVSVTDKASIKKLIDIGEKREHALKDYLIEEGKLPSSRILLCKPKIDSSEGAIPHIAISV
ncbi:DUF748 domain-containing protein [Colwellia echini]|uniref:DUF748 domain-containing protein n=1 Tax=Colwellia echini TaxID=1982103 RepID=A0ABY3N0U5_9GAMM|nr:DUF748 domain-containing protein [Colwellia echini]TYK67116.1 DUF748 domain-containing protein [Colwellia echini]